MTSLGSSRSRPTFIRLLPFLPLLAVMIMEYQVIADTVRRWLVFEESYSQGSLLLVVAIYVFVRKYRQVRPVEGFYPFWLIPFALGLAVYALGAFILIQAFQQLVLLPLMWCSLAIFWGWRQARHFIVSIGVMFFSINIWEIIRPHLQYLTTHVDGFFLGLLGVKFYVVGTFVHLPGIGSFHVARGCSGLNYFLVGLTIAFLYGELRDMRWRNRFLLAAVGGFMSLVANWIRAFCIIYAGYASDMKSSLVTNHNTFGWVVFALSLLPMFWLAKRLEIAEAAPYEAHPVDVDPKNAGARKAWVALLLSVALTACTGFISREPDEGSFGGKFSYDFPLMNPDKWVPMFDKRLLDWKPAIDNADAREIKTFKVIPTNDSAEQASLKLLVSLDTYNYQRDGAEVVQWGNFLYNSDLQNPVNHFIVNVGNGVRLSGMVLHSQHFDKNIYLAYGYYVGGQWVSDGLDVKVAQLRGVFHHRRDASRLIFGITCAQCSAKQAEKELARVGADLVPRVKANLDKHFE